MTASRRHDHAVRAETKAVAQRILEDAECAACLAARPKNER